MKVKILNAKFKSYWYSDLIGEELIVKYDINDRTDPYTNFIKQFQVIREQDAVITELPESFCVKKCDDVEKWNKYIKWLWKKYEKKIYGIYWEYYGYSVGFECRDEPFGTEIHIDDIIKHIEYMESQLTVNMNKEFEAEFDLTTDEGRLAYAKKYYPIGTRVTNTIGERVTVEEIFFCDEHHIRLQIGEGLIYDGDTNKWAEIIKKETNMQKQKLSRKGLKEIHSVACPSWKTTLEQVGSRNPLEDYIELTQEEVDKMFLACTKEQLPIVSKYLKKNDGSVGLSFINNKKLVEESYDIIGIIGTGDYAHKSFWLTDIYNWEIKTDSAGRLCLIPTKKKFSAEKGWVL